MRFHSLTWRRPAAAAVHILTASGAALGLLSLLASERGDWEVAFAWLGAALIVDGIDGPLARKVDVVQALPRFSGKDLDLIVDYLTYVTVPAFIVARSELAPPSVAVPLSLLIMLVSLYHFSDTGSKTREGYFVGFPAIWNVVVLYCFVLGLSQGLVAALILLCSFLTFVPLRWLHPLRVKRFRAPTVGVMAFWGAAAIAAVSRGFPGTNWEKIVFCGTAVYILAIGLTAKTDDPAATIAAK